MNKVKNLTILFLITIFSGLILFSFTFNNGNPEPQKAPKIVFEELKHDFGTVPSGPAIEYSFKFKNKGGEILLIKEIITSCGCTGATVGDQKEYKKNEKGTVKVTFNTQGREGKQEKTILVKTNDPFNPQVVLTISCEIDPNIN